MSVFADKHIAAAIARLPTTPSQRVQALLQTARDNNLTALQAACEAELARRPFEFTADNAIRFEAMAAAVRDMNLVEATRYAFGTVRPAGPDEAGILRWIAEHPGTSYEAALAAYGKGDLSLLIGHLVYDRYGCFRQFLKPSEDQSSVLLIKDRTLRSVRYWLKPEAEGVFRELQVI